MCLSSLMLLFSVYMLSLEVARIPQLIFICFFCFGRVFCEGDSKKTWKYHTWA